ncbi:DUF4030 domain-containing protein [Peribacillus sp. R9-11]|uniref:DUF4030 domain-containing protein n=1 Tax=Peribacillus sp. R9-11 TaxID=3073271 RepID=UPI002868958B|nr:DUF4030 domain-containing protein [Peribacillus sp. R9-11]WMX58712.1 DUF4030 domain-containing protein [Peribacillus sp. R9-11]
MDNKIRQEMDKIEIPKELNIRVILGMENAKKDYERHNQLKPESKSDRKRWSLRKKIMFFSSVAVLLLGLLISSAFVSPAMAKVISNIPYLGSIFQSESISSLIIDELEEKGYKISGTGISYKPKKELEVRVEGSDDYFNEVKDEIEKTVKGILKSKGYDAYSVKVSKELAQNDYVLNEEELKEKTILDNEVTKKLKQLDYKFDLVQTDPKEKIIYIDIDGSKKYYDAVKDDVEKTALDVTELNNYKDYSIDVNRPTVKIAKADTGALITPAIAEGLMSIKEFKVTGVGYKEKPLSFIISTSIPSSDSEAKALGTEIESMIVEFLKSEEISKILGEESYEIIVKSKDKKKIN